MDLKLTLRGRGSRGVDIRVSARTRLILRRLSGVLLVGAEVGEVKDFPLIL